MIGSFATIKETDQSICLKTLASQGFKQIARFYTNRCQTSFTHNAKKRGKALLSALLETLLPYLPETPIEPLELGFYCS
ncbi:hypothetical protein C7B82_16235 [Stenomitos frigidus ULC18]|uniref:Uncharacterized protein n=1 Tax=Stenomitos frigidus ULC18 TaxID=2107698 RepID=A0A2T1E4J0_9CYAN|nr:hypothetical protein C7B82_16235 [Stenomitos frigidus ULC18]